MGTLDRSKPFGQVMGTAGHIYEQDGKKFDGMGSEVGGLEAEISKPDNVETPAGMTKDKSFYTNFGKISTPESEEMPPETVESPKPEKKRGRPPKK